jgi:hypothetical protein
MNSMRKGLKTALACGSVPFLTLVLALPFVNRIRPVILGLPFILFWILLWVGLTPDFLFLADRALRKDEAGKEKGR